MDHSNYKLYRQEGNKTYISLKEFAEYAGISMSTVYKYSSSGQVPVYKPFGKHTFVKVEEIARIFEESRSSSNQELEIKADSLSFGNTSIAQ